MSGAANGAPGAYVEDYHVRLRGELGVTFEQMHGRAVVRRVSRESHRAGVELGSVLLAVDDIDCTALPFEETMERLKVTQERSLRFRRARRVQGSLARWGGIPRVGAAAARRPSRTRCRATAAL